MPDLRRIQADFGDALRDADQSPRAARWLAGAPDLAGQRLAIYRANMVAAADKALGAAYPVVQQVVGAEFFHGLARAHQRETPSTSGDLTEFGAEFARFLAAFPHTQSLPYLPDLARLEWAVHRAYGAADAADWDSSTLLSVDPDLQEAIRFELAPGTAVIESPYPIAHLWTIHQAGYAGEFAVDWAIPERALVARHDFLVTVSALAAADAAFVEQVRGGSTLVAAAGAALAIAPDFDLGAFLARAMACGLVCGFTLAPTPTP